MKKSFLFLFSLTIVLLSSCNNKKEDKEVTIESKATNRLEVPKFQSSELERHAVGYTEYLKNLANAAQTKDSLSLSNLQSQAVNWELKEKEVLKNVSADDTKLWNDYYAKLTTVKVSAAN